VVISFISIIPDIVVVAVPTEARGHLPLDLLHDDQIVVDCSNSLGKKKESEPSNAEILATMCKGG